MKKSLRIFRILLAYFIILAVGVFAIFLVLDFFPTAVDVNSYYFPNLAVRYAYVVDSDLIFRSRPIHLVFHTYGGSYNTAYGEIGAPAEKYRAEMTVGPSGFPDEPSRGPYDVIALGDSFFQVASNSSDSFPRLFETVSGARTLNTGMAWYGPFQYLEVFRRFATMSGARVAIMGFSESSDMADESEYLKWKSGGDYYDGEFRFHADTSLWRRFLFFLDDLSTFYSRASFLQKKLSPDKFAGELIELNLNGQRQKVRFAHSPERRTAPAIMGATDGLALRKIFTDFKNLADSKNIFPVVVFLPSFEHIYAPYTTDGSGVKWKSIRAEALRDRSNIEDVVKTLTHDAHVEFIDVVPAFEAKAAKGELLYPPFDPHWNPRGRQLGAEEVTRRLIELGQIPGKKP